MAENETKAGANDRWADLLPEAVQKLWEEMQTTMHDEPICMNCENRVWPLRLSEEYDVAPWRVRYPVCACHVDSPGVPREICPGESCANFRPRPKVVVRSDTPPERTRPSDRFIPLTRGMWAAVDARDFEWLSQYSWCASPSGGGKMYARRNTKAGTVLMHREIMKTPRGMHVDHKDRNGLNNRRDNLRNCTPAQNQYNKRPRGKRSRFKGVYPHGDKWQAMIKHKGELYNLGLFDDDVEAAKVRDREAYELEGEFAYLNFPDLIRRTKSGGRKPENRGQRKRRKR